MRRVATRRYVFAHREASRFHRISETHSTGRNKEKALQPKSLQSLIFTQSGRRDLNPRPPEPHSNEPGKCSPRTREAIHGIHGLTFSGSPGPRPGRTALSH